MGDVRVLTWAEVVEVVMAVAEEEWALGVQDKPLTPHFSRIDGYIRGDQGLGWGSVEVGRGARPNIPYRANGDFAWCGAFAAWAHGAAGLDPAIRKRQWSSVSRLWSWGQYAPSHLKEPADLRERHGDTPRLFQQIKVGRDLKWAPRPGDILLVGRASSRAWGNHVTTVRSFDEQRGLFLTVEGNAKGTQMDGKRREGNVHQVRPMPTRSQADKLYRARAILRPSPLDYRPVQAGELLARLRAASRVRPTV